MVTKEANFEFLGKQSVKVVVKFLHIDTENKKNLCCDIYDENDNLIYADKAWVLGTQPFEFEESELDE